MPEPAGTQTWRRWKITVSVALALALAAQTQAGPSIAIDPGSGATTRPAVTTRPAGGAGASNTTTAPTTAVVDLLHIADSHGRTRPYQHKGETVGGYARLASAVRAHRAASRADRVFLVHAGDVLSRGDKLTRKTLGAANVALLNHLRFDLWTPGNGEYYDGSENLLKLAQLFRGHVLAANVSIKSTGEPLARRAAILQAGPVKVGFVGLCFVRTNLPSAWSLKVDDATATAAKWVPSLRKHADLVVVVSHLGFDADKKLAAAVPGIDVILGGHSHTKLAKGHVVQHDDGSETLIAHPWDYLKAMGRVRVRMARRGDAWEILGAEADLVALDADVKESPAMRALVQRLWKHPEQAARLATPTTRPAEDKSSRTGNRSASGASER